MIPSELTNTVQVHNVPHGNEHEYFFNMNQTSYSLSSYFFINFRSNTHLCVLVLQGSPILL